MEGRTVCVYRLRAQREKRKDRAFGQLGYSTAITSYETLRLW